MLVVTKEWQFDHLLSKICCAQGWAGSIWSMKIVILFFSHNMKLSWVTWLHYLNFHKTFDWTKAYIYKKVTHHNSQFFMFYLQVWIFDSHKLKNNQRKALNLFLQFHDNFFPRLIGSHGVMKIEVFSFHWISVWPVSTFPDILQNATYFDSPYIKCWGHGSYGTFLFTSLCTNYYKPC